MTQELTRDFRDALIAQHLAEGLRPGEIQAKLGIDQNTLWRSMNRLKAAIMQELGQGVAAWREKQLAELQAMREEIAQYKKDGKPLPLRALDRLLRVIDLEASLVGSHAPTKTVTASVGARAEGPNMEVIGLDECPMCGGGLDQSGRPQPMMVKHDFMVPSPDGPRLATQKELDAPHQELYSPNSKQVSLPPAREDGDAQG